MNNKTDIKKNRSTLSGAVSVSQKKPWMTEVQAEEIVMAAIVGEFKGRPSELAHAHLLLGSRNTEK